MVEFLKTSTCLTCPQLKRSACFLAFGVKATKTDCEEIIHEFGGETVLPYQ